MALTLQLRLLLQQAATPSSRALMPLQPQQQLPQQLAPALRAPGGFHSLASSLVDGREGREATQRAWWSSTAILVS